VTNAAPFLLSACDREYRTGVTYGRRDLALFTIALAALTACAETSPDARSAQIVSTFTRADQSLLRTRPAFVAGRYARMARAPYDFYRGNVPLFARDWRDGTLTVSRSRFALDAPLPVGLGDAHPENFGTLLARDGTLALEPNDFDGADRVPYLWDLRRLTAGLVLAARLSNEGDADARAVTSRAARDIAREAAVAYARAVTRYAAGATRARITAGDASAILSDLFRRAARDAGRRDELDELTTLTNGARTLKRGEVDPDDPENVLRDLPAEPRASIRAALEAYRATLIAPPPAEFFTVLDAARVMGSGVASFPRVRVLLLVQGPTSAPGDDVILELKELADSGSPGWLPPGVFFDDVATRVMTCARAAWSRPDADPLWGTTTWLGLPVQIRTETAAAKTVRVARMTGDQGTPQALTGLARELGALVARVHASPVPEGANVAQAIRDAIGADVSAFADEQADAATVYADLVLADWERFRQALRERGPLLGFTPDAQDAPTPAVRALYGTPAPVRDF